MQTEQENARELEISLKQIFTALWQKAWLILAVAVAAAAFMLAVSTWMITPKYQSSATFYVNNSTSANTLGNSNISSSDITAAKSLVDSYIIILTTRETLEPVIEAADLKLSFEQIKDMISAKSVNSTEFFEVVVTSTDPEEAYEIAQAITQVLPPRIGKIIEGSSAEVVEYPVEAQAPSSPNVLMNTILGFLMGAIVVAIVLFLRELFDTTVRSQEDVTSTCDYPILTEVPDMSAAGKGAGYQSSYYARTAKTTGEYAKAAPRKESGLFGENLSFTSSEAYKLLRTKLQFSFADDQNCRILGVVSALAGEGKSLTSSNLAYTMAQLEKRVLLIEGDMRRPSLSAKMSIRRLPGLSNYLTGQAKLDELIQTCQFTTGKTSFHVIAAGRTPPNPIELLSSPRMEKLLENLRGQYDYIIIDLPPVGEVSDALVVANQVDGMLMVVRQHYCNRVSLANAVRQFKFVGGKVLGIVFNCTVERTNVYSRKYYYGRRYGKYAYGKYAYSKHAYGRSAGSYAAAAKKAKKQEKELPPAPPADPPITPEV